MLFLAINKHQFLYFSKVSSFIGCGVVSYPVFTLLGLRHFSIKEVRSIGWSDIIDEKCRERDVKQKYSGWMYRFLVFLELLFFYVSIKCKVKKNDIDTILMWNGSHRYQRVISSLYQDKLRLVYFENGLLPNTTTCDFKGVNYLNSVPRDKAFYLELYNKYKVDSQSFDKNLIPRSTKKVSEEVELPKEFVFVPFQDDRDTQIRNFSPVFKDMRDLYEFISTSLSSSDNVFVVKEHPNSKIDYTDLHYKDKYIVFANGNSTQELIVKSKAVLTINSTVGLESILLGANVITVGNAFYNIPGLVQHCSSRAKLKEIFKKEINFIVDNKVRVSFLYYLKGFYCVPGDWKNPSIKHLSFLRDKLT